MKNTKITRSDKDWINGFFVGAETGEEQMLDWLIQMLKKKRKKLRKKKLL